MPKAGIQTTGMSAVDIQRGKLVGKIPSNRLNPNSREPVGRMSRVMKRGGDHELADHVNRDDAQGGEELQPLLGKNE
jgi:hypothetical protein